MYSAPKLGDVHSRYYFPFQAVHLVLHREVQAYLHHLLAAHLESIGIVFCLYLGESLLGTLVELQFHHVDGICRFHRDIDSALCLTATTPTTRGIGSRRSTSCLPCSPTIASMWNRILRRAESISRWRRMIPST